MTLRMWVVENDQYGATERKFYVDDPVHIPRVGEFVDADLAGGWVSGIQWNFTESVTTRQRANFSTVYVFLKANKND